MTFADIDPVSSFVPGARVVGVDKHGTKRRGKITALKTVEVAVVGEVKRYHVHFDKDKGVRWCTKHEMRLL